MRRQGAELIAADCLTKRSSWPRFVDVRVNRETALLFSEAAASDANSKKMSERNYAMIDQLEFTEVERIVVIDLLEQIQSELLKKLFIPNHLWYAHRSTVV